MPPRRAPAQDFHDRVAEFDGIAQIPSLEQDLLTATVEGIENTGLPLVANGKLSAVEFATGMRGVYSQAVELETVPPLDEDQRTRYTGKVVTYTAMSEVTAPKQPKVAKPTDTNRTKTNGAKK